MLYLIWCKVFRRGEFLFQKFDVDSITIQKYIFIILLCFNSDLCSLTRDLPLKNEKRQEATIAINELNMARRQCLRLITVDETTVSSSRSSSSSLLLLLFCFAYISALRCIAPLFFFFFFFFSPSASALLLHRVPRTTSLIFSSPFLTLLFFFEIFLISFYFVLRAQCFPFSLRHRSPRLFFLLLYPRRLLHFTRLRSLLSPCLILGFFSFVITYEQYASTKAAARRSGLNVPHRNWKRTW